MKCLVALGMFISMAAWADRMPYPEAQSACGRIGDSEYYLARVLTKDRKTFHCEKSRLQENGLYKAVRKGNATSLDLVWAFTEDPFSKGYAANYINGIYGYRNRDRDNLSPNAKVFVLPGDLCSEGEIGTIFQEGRQVKMLTVKDFDLKLLRDERGGDGCLEYDRSIHLKFVADKEVVYVDDKGKIFSFPVRTK